MTAVQREYKTKKKEVSLLGLFGKESLESIQKNLAAGTDFSFSIIDFKGEEVTNSLILNQYCNNKKKTGACQTCRMNAAFAAAKAAITNNPYLFECEQGLVLASIPVIVSNQYLGAVICGQVRCCDKHKLPDKETVDLNIEAHIEPDEKLNHYYQQIPEFSYDKIVAVSALVNHYFCSMCEKEAYAQILADYDHKEVHLRDLRKRINALNKQVASLDRKAMRGNLLPQLLLNMIVTASNYAIIEDATVTEQLLHDFSKILRYHIDLEQDKVTLASELDQIETYLKIIAERYDNRIKLRIKDKKESERQMILKLSLFPLAEYIVNFGVLATNFKGTLYLDTTYTLDRCSISMQFEHSDTNANSMGYLNQTGSVIEESNFNYQLEQLKRRLTYEYGEDYSLKIQNNMILMDIPRTSDDEVVN